MTWLDELHLTQVVEEGELLDRHQFLSGHFLKFLIGRFSEVAGQGWLGDILEGVNRES